MKDFAQSLAVSVVDLTCTSRPYHARVEKSVNSTRIRRSLIRSLGGESDRGSKFR